MMKNCTTRYFCRIFGACTAGMRFALKFKTMRECYGALLKGEAGDKSAEWAIWTVTQEGVMSDRELRLFAVRCARSVQHLMKDQSSIGALDVAERYANGEASKHELLDAARAADVAARAAAHDGYVAAWDAYFAAYSAACSARYVVRDTYFAADAAADAAAWGAYSTADVAARAAARAAERRKQLKILAEFGNPFAED